MYSINLSEKHTLGRSLQKRIVEHKHIVKGRRKEMVWRFTPGITVTGLSVRVPRLSQSQTCSNILDLQILQPKLESYIKQILATQHQWQIQDFLKGGSDVAMHVGKKKGTTPTFDYNHTL